MQTKKLKKKGFTLVELVVVVAVIAVLSAILIPAIGCFVEEAKETNDMATVRLLNAALVEDGAENDTPKTMSDAISAMGRKGYDIEKLTPRSSGDILWDSANNRFMLVKGDEILYRDNTTKESAKSDWWKVIAKDQALSEIYSNYLKDGYTAENALTAYTGVDVGNNRNVSVSYSPKKAQNVIFNLNGGEFTVNDTFNGKQYVYGKADSADISTGNDCLYVYATIGAMKVKAGKVIADKNSYVAIIEAASSITLQEQNGGLFIIPTNADVSKIDETVATSIGYTKTNDSYVANEEKQDKSFYDISSVEKLCEYRDLINRGVSVPYAKLTADIDMSSVKWTDSIGTSTYVFMNGKFDGNGHSITNLSNGDRITNDDYTSPTSKTTGNIFGMFGYVGGVVEIVDLKVNVSASIPDGMACAGLISNVNENSEVAIKNVSVDGKLYATKEKAAGFIGCVNGNSTVTLTNCVNKTDVESHERISGFISQVASNDSIAFINCQNEGKIELAPDSSLTRYGVAAGFISHVNGAAVSYDDKCANKGTVNAPLAANYHTYAGAILYQNGAWAGAKGNTALKNIMLIKGVIYSDSARAYAKAAEEYIGLHNAFDGILYNDNNDYAVFFYGEVNKYSEFENVPCRFTEEEWNNKTTKSAAAIEKDSTVSYKIILQKDLNWSATYTLGTCINMTIDLNGHTLTASGTILSGNGGTKIVVKNGTLNKNTGVTIFGEKIASSVIDKTTVTGNYND